MTTLTSSQIDEKLTQLSIAGPDAVAGFTEDERRSLSNLFDGLAACRLPVEIKAGRVDGAPRSGDNGLNGAPVGWSESDDVEAPHVASERAYAVIGGAR